MSVLPSFPRWLWSEVEKGDRPETMRADKSNNFAYNPRLQAFANRLRKKMTKAEVCFWKYVLRARQVKGYQFRRQRPILNYIADFMCKELMLVVEVDGFTHHLWDETIERDRRKEYDLRESGFKVIRISNEAVLTNIVGVRQMIEEVIDEIEESTPGPPPALVSAHT